MIVPMKKLSAFIFYKDYTEFLERLRELGVLHISLSQDKSGSSELSDKLDLVKRYAVVIKFLQRYKAEAQGDFNDAYSLLEDVEGKRKRLEKIEQLIAHIRKDISAQEPWGEYSEALISNLADEGARIDFFVCSHNKFVEDWKDEYNAMEIAVAGGQSYFITVSFDGQQPDIEAEHIEMPKKNLKELYNDADKLEQEKKDIYDFFGKAASAVDILQVEQQNVKDEFNFDKVVTSTRSIVEDKVMMLEGWVPQDKLGNLTDWINEQNVYYELREPVKEDKVPIKLKNNKFARLFQSIGELYSLPNYGEIDLTPFFAPFFMLFFGFCLGDAGYGLLILLGTTLYKRKAKKELKPVLSLCQWLGLATVIMGMVGGTFFGINLIESDISWLEGAKKYMLDSNNLFTLSLIIGAVQIIFGMFIKLANQIKQGGITNGFSTIGWLILILGSGLCYWLETKGTDVKIFQYTVLGIGAVFILLLNDPKRNIFMNIGVGIWDVYNMLTGLLGDVLSYIRLFALGISSAVLGLVFNDLAMNMSPDFPVIKQLVMLFILVFGHGINIFMSGLGSFVHPMRLTFVEFYKNAGFSGGGKKYEPFAKSKVN